MSEARIEACIPAPALAYGLGGIIPFAGLAIFQHIGPEVWIAHAQFALLTYGAVILSFLGGIYWGLAIKAEESRSLWVTLGISVVPSLLGWVALLLIPSLGLLLLIAAFLAMFLMDKLSARDAFSPPWYVKLRAILTTSVVGCLVIAGIA